MMKKNFWVLALGYAMFLSACGQEGPKHEDDVTSGKIDISVDDNYQFLADTQVSTFMALYPKAVITPHYKSEEECFNDLKNNKARVILVNRELNASETAYFDSIKIYPKATKIANDAVAFIVNKDNLDTNLTFGHLHHIFTGKITKWTDIDKKSKLGNIQVVFDGKGSSNARFISEKFQVTQFPDYVQTANSNREVIKYVEEHPNSLGVIGVNWISDKDDSLAMSFLKNNRVVYISDAQDTSMNHDFYPPLAGHVALGEYPFSRPVYMIKREAYFGLGTGFVNFNYGDKGQKIIYLMGLTPSNIKPRVVRVK